MANFSFQDVLDEVGKQATAAGLDPLIAKSIVTAENTGSGSTTSRKELSGDAKSPVGAMGLMQVMPATAKGLQQAGYLPTDWQHNPDDLPSQVQAGIAAMKEKLGRIRNPSDLREWASVYNGSSKTHANYKAGKLDAIPAETTQYGSKLERAYMELGGAAQNNPSAYVAGSNSPATTARPAAPTTSSSTRTTTRSTLFDSGQLDAFQTDILGATSPGGIYDRASQMLIDSSVESKLANSNLQQAIIAEGTAAGQAALDTTATQAAAQAKRAAILSSMNLDPTANGNELQRAFDTVNSSDRQLAAMRPEIDKRMAVGLFDNPLEWLVNQVRLPGMVAQYNGVVGARKDAIDRYKDVSSLALTQQTLSSSTEADQLLRQGASSAANFAASAAAKAAEYTARNAGADARTAMTLAALTGQKLSLQAQALNMTKQSQTESAGESERTAAARAVEAEFQTVNARIVSAGGAPIENLTLFKQLSGPERTILVQGASSGKFGKDLASSAAFVDKYGNANQMALTGDSVAARWIKGTTNQAASLVLPMQEQAAKLGKKFNAADAVEAQINAMQTKYEAEANNNMRNASEFNPFKIDYASAAKSPELSKNAMAQWLNTYGPKGTTPMMDTVDENFVIRKFADSVTAGAMSAGDASKTIADFYKIATAQTALSSKWAMMGMNKPDKTYPVKLTTVGDSPVPADLGNVGAVERALMQQIIYNRAISFKSATGLYPGVLMTGGEMAGRAIGEHIKGKN